MMDLKKSLLYVLTSAQMLFFSAGELKSQSLQKDFSSQEIPAIVVSKDNDADGVADAHYLEQRFGDSLLYRGEYIDIDFDGVVDVFNEYYFRPHGLSELNQQKNMQDSSLTNVPSWIKNLSDSITMYVGFENCYPKFQESFKNYFLYQQKPLPGEENSFLNILQAERLNENLLQEIRDGYLVSRSYFYDSVASHNLVGKFFEPESQKIYREYVSLYSQSLTGVLENMSLYVKNSQVSQEHHFSTESVVDFSDFTLEEMSDLFLSLKKSQVFAKKFLEHPQKKYLYAIHDCQVEFSKNWNAYKNNSLKRSIKINPQKSFYDVEAIFSDK